MAPLGIKSVGSSAVSGESALDDMGRPQRPPPVQDPLADTAEAFRYLLTGHVAGKIVIVA